MAGAGHPSISSFSTSSQKQNAFDVMGLAAHAQGIKRKRMLEKLEFVEAEAQESDDDEAFGFRGRRKEDDEGDGEDLDKSLETLVDDQDMDEETVNEPRVLEKYQ